LTCQEAFEMVVVFKLDNVKEFLKPIWFNSEPCVYDSGVLWQWRSILQSSGLWHCQ
jgi:hypothetical protein